MDGAQWSRFAFNPHGRSWAARWSMEVISSGFPGFSGFFTFWKLCQPKFSNLVNGGTTKFSAKLYIAWRNSKRIRRFQICSIFVKQKPVESRWNDLQFCFWVRDDPTIPPVTNFAGRVDGAILVSGGIGGFVAERLLGTFSSQKIFYRASRELSNCIKLNHKITKIGQVMEWKGIQSGGIYSGDGKIKNWKSSLGGRCCDPADLGHSFATKFSFPVSFIHYFPLKGLYCRADGAIWRAEVAHAAHQRAAATGCVDQITAKGQTVTCSRKDKV